MTKTSKAFRFRTTVLAVALACAPAVSQAAGMGKLNVYSTLGQPLRAEIELSATPEEISGMNAKLASPDSYKQAGMDFSPTLLGLRFSVDKRADGRSVVRLSSDRPINDPFVDVLMELNWGSGRLVREYTFLLDPPEVSNKVTPTLSSAEARVPATTASTPRAAESGDATPPAAAKRPAKVDSRKKPKTDDADSGEQAAAKPAVRTAKVKTAATSATFDGGNAAVAATRPVNKGDTLAAIAAETRYEGVTLEQMLVSLFRANPDSFDGGNMNRLRAGSIIGVPNKETVEAVSADDAKQVMRTQAQDWNAYRRKLAGAVADAPAREEGRTQAAAGRITPKVDEASKPAQAAQDQVKIGKTEVGKDDRAAKAGAKDVRASALEEDLVAKDKALKEAQQRLASLEKNVADLQKLVELKNQNMADLQKQAAGKTAAPEKTAPVAEAAKVAEKPTEKPVDKTTDKAADKPAEQAAAKPAEPGTDKPAEAAVPAAPPADPSKPSGDTFPIDKAATPPAPEAAKPAAPVVPPPAPQPEPSFVDELLGSPLQLGGMAAALLAGIGGLLVARRRRSAQEEAPAPTEPESVVVAEAAPVAPTADTPTVAASASAEFSQAGPGAIDTDDVDPVAEADVYIAYGRDEQAEEILLEARQRDPGRLSILAKLLEIYAKRGDLANYAATATALRDVTGGAGEEWRQAAETGARLDPANPLYGAADAGLAPLAELEPPAAEPEAFAVAPEAPTELAAFEPEPVDDLTSLDFELSLHDTPAESATADLPAAEPMPELLAEPEPAVDVVAEAPVDDSTTLDFDLDALTVVPAAEPALEPAPAASPVVADGNALDFDFELPGAAEAAPAEAADAAEALAPADDGNTLQFDPSALSLGELDAAPVEVEEAPAPAEASDDTVLDFSFDDLPAADEPAPAVVEAEPAAVIEAEEDAAADMISFDLPTADVAEEVTAEATEDAAEELAEVLAAEPEATSSAAMIDLDQLEPIPMSDELAADLARVQALHEEADQAAVAAPDSGDTLLDFDLGDDSAAATEVAAADAETLLELPPLDDLPVAVEELPTPSFDLSAISLDLDEPPAETVAPVAASEVDAEAESAAGDDGHSSDLLHSLAASVAAEEVDLSSFEAVDEALFEASPVPESAATGETTPHWQEVETKLDLAKAYEEMGDVEGARELLSEVISEGTEAQQAKARDMLEHILG